MATEIKRIDPNANSFMADGIKYLIHADLTLKRFEVFEKLQLEVGFGVDFENVASSIKQAYNSLQNSKSADASVTLHNLLQGISKKLSNRESPAMLLCSLFVCAEDEDLAEWNETEAIEKIAHWRKEGISASDFFNLAFYSVKGFMECLDNDSRDTTETTPEAYIAPQ